MFVEKLLRNVFFFHERGGRITSAKNIGQLEFSVSITSISALGCLGVQGHS